MTPDERDSGRVATSTSTEAREVFEASTDFTIGLEEEFAIVDPETLELEHRFEDLHAACQRGRPAGRGRRGRADRHRDRDPLRARPRRFAEAIERQRERRARLFALADEHGACPGGDRDPSVGELPRPADHRHAALPPPARGAALGGAAQQHLEPARPRRACAAPTARSPSATTCAGVLPAAARAVGELAVPRRPRHRPALGADRDLHPDVPALRGPRAVRRLGRVRGLRRRSSSAPDSIVEATQLWWSVRPHHAFGTVELRICDAQTRGERVVRARRADRRLHRPGGARLRRRAPRRRRFASGRSRRTSGGRSATGWTAG